MFGQDKLSYEETAQYIFNAVSSSRGNHHNLRDIIKKELNYMRKNKSNEVGRMKHIRILSAYLRLYEDVMPDKFGVKYIRDKEDGGLIIDDDAGPRHPKEADYENYWPIPYHHN